MHRATVWVLLVAASLVPGRALTAACPRTGREKARRIIPSVVFWPAAPFILSHQQSHVPMPASGARVRVSREVNGRMTFTEGRFVSAADSVLRLITTSGDTAVFPYADARCLQVHRTSRKIGAALGLLTGAAAGMAIGAGVGSAATPDDEDVMFFSAAVGGLIGQLTGPIVGAGVGASAWDVAWERPKL